MSPLVQKKSTQFRLFKFGSELVFCHVNREIAMEIDKKGKYFINNTVYKGADLRIWPIQQKIVSRKMLLLEI